MTCLFCHYEFCYHCGAEAGSRSLHFVPGMGCGAGQYSEVKSQSFWYVILRKFAVVLILLLLVYPLLVLFTPSIFLVIICAKIGSQ